MIKSNKGLAFFRWRIPVCFALLSMLWLSCTKSPKREHKILLATAASAQFYAAELAQAFEAKYAVPVDLVVGSSGRLTTQLNNGAPYDIFLSADSTYTNLLEQRGLTILPPVTFGKGMPVLWSLKANLSTNSVSEVLNSSSIDRIAIANPVNAPYGASAWKYIEDHRLVKQLSDQLVYGESLAQVNEYVMQQVVDVGFCAEISLLSGPLSEQGEFIPLGVGYEVPHTIALIRNQKKDTLKRQFLNFMSSEEGLILLSKYGFTK
ncbi:MAG: molybdate ABC transporter substrate-binding protein [Bacteroidota bacterium]